MKLTVTPRGSLINLTFLLGIVLVVPGLLKLGRLVRFISNAVMIGFLSWVSITIILSQLGDSPAIRVNFPIQW